MKASKETITRTIILILTIINSFLALFGKSPLPIDSDTVTNIVSMILTTVAALVNWWYNNSYTDAAIEADIIKKRLKAGYDQDQAVDTTAVD